MSGTDHSNEDFQSGRTNRAEDTTKFWAQRQNDDDPDDRGFNGDAIVIIEAAANGEGTGFELEEGEAYFGEYLPKQKLDGLVSYGWSGFWSLDTRGGVGVIGIGGYREGTGILGQGGGSRADGGGIGVHAIGGSIVQLQRPGFPKDALPGPGLRAEGGKWDASNNTARRNHAPGIMARAGKAQPFASYDDTSGMGLLSVGADADHSYAVRDDGGGDLAGQPTPGAGIIGRGGISVATGNGADGKPLLAPQDAGAGVIGIAGGQGYPGDTFTDGSGVIGIGKSGVRGITRTAETGRGGEFFAQTDMIQAQLRLRPVNTDQPLPAAVKTTPNAFPQQINERGFFVELPRSGLPGDLLALAGTDDTGNQTTSLWFCIGFTAVGRGLWAQVLLGPATEGVR